MTEKARLVRERYDLATYPTIYAYGDTPEDLDMLAIAAQQYYQWQEVGVAGGLTRELDSSRRRFAARLNSGVRHHEGSGDHRNFEPTIRGAKRH